MTDKLLFAGDEPFPRTGPMKIGSPEFRTPAVLLVAGSRHYTNREHVFREIDKWIALHGRPAKLISGECATGVDLLAKIYAQQHKIDYEGFAAKWSGSGRQRRACGPMRNAKMIDLCTHLLAFPSTTHSPGTKDTIRKARLKHLPVTEIKVVV